MEKIGNIEVTGDIEYPINNTVMAIGTNPTGSEKVQWIYQI